MGTRVQSSVDFKIFDDRILSRYAARGLKGSATSSPTAGLAPDGSGTVKAPSLVSSNMIIHHETAESTSVPSLTTKDKANLARIRDNQRRSRQRRKEYLEELEARLRQCTLQETEYSFQVRRATERVADENQQLRMLLNRTGVGDVTIKNYLQGTVSSETIIGPARSLSPKLLPNPYPPGASTGKASPYSNADDTTSLEDGSAGSACGSDSTTSPSIELGLVLDPSKLSIFNQAMHRFWEFFNPKLNAGISWRAGGTEAHRSSSSFTGGRSFQQQALSQSTIRKHEHQDDEVDNLSDEGNRRPPKRPKSDFLSQVDGDTSLKFACPFRKHNPRKYNMHQYKSCALSSFESIARVK
jgi:hypothetical protein